MRVRDALAACKYVVDGDEEPAVEDAIETALHELAHVMTLPAHKRNLMLGFLPIRPQEVATAINHYGQETDSGEIRANAIAIETAKILFPRNKILREGIEEAAMLNAPGNTGLGAEIVGRRIREAQTKKVTKTKARFLARYLQSIVEKDLKQSSAND